MFFHFEGMRTKFRHALITLLFLLPLLPVRAEEGMWLFSNPPREQLKARYGFDLTAEWLDHLMRSSVRFNSGGSGSFVSADGLVITNHHVGSDAIQKLSTAERDLLRDGFIARSPDEEIPCVDLELNVLQSIEDVTARVNAAIPLNATDAEATAARRRVMAEIEQESRETTGLRSDVVTLYQGGLYHLYRYQRYTDIRLVFAPESAAAAFGGDPDNFEYPRYCLDFALFRVYADGRPLPVQDFLAWSPVGAQPGELTFVSGHPGRTSRLLTSAELIYQRDHFLPASVESLHRREVLLSAWSARSLENERRAQDDLVGVQNGRKVREGNLAALQDPVFLGARLAAEAAFKARLRDMPDGAAALAAFDRIAGAQSALAKKALRTRFLSMGQGFWSESFSLARTLLRAAEESAKPNGERLREYSDARRESLELTLFSEQPIHPDLEIVKLADSLSHLVASLGADDPLVQQILAGQSPRQRAAALINGTRVRDVPFRRELYAGGVEAVRSAQDPMIELARLIDPEARALRLHSEQQDEIKQQAQAVLSAARFALEGTNVYPDATFTLRLSYGTVQGYEEDGQPVPPMTVAAGLFERNRLQQNRPPFDLAPRWAERAAAVDPATPFNFVSTHDIIGGNSGSPVVNRAGEFVGIIFDGNRQSLSADYAYSDVEARAVSVHSAIILEALRKVYDAGFLADELLQGRR